MIPVEAVKLVLSFLNDDMPIRWLPKADAIFVCCFIDERVAKHAAKLFFKNKGDKILVTGGIGTLGRSPNGFPSEAENYAAVLRGQGVPEDALILETKASNTLENVLLGTQACYQAGLEIHSLIVVALPPLLRRARATFKRQFPGIATFGSGPVIHESEWKNDPFRVRRIIAEVDRLERYAEKGDIAFTRIPREIVEACKLISSCLT